MDLDRQFGLPEREIIVLAATHKNECKGLSPGEPAKGWRAAFRRGIVPDAAGKPLENGRLEALRRLTCACFSSRGRPGREIVRSALAAGVSSKQIAAINGLARRYGKGP